MGGWLDRERGVVEFGAHVNFWGDRRMSMEGAPPLWLVLPLLISLKHVPGTVFFPLVGCGVVILVEGRLAW